MNLFEKVLDWPLGGGAMMGTEVLRYVLFQIRAVAQRLYPLVPSRSDYNRRIDMLIHEVCKQANLTRKAVEYYTGKGLVHPVLLENGYRDYEEGDVEILRRIGVLRRLGVGMEDIREILQDGTGEALQRAALRRELESRRKVRRDVLLRELSEGKEFSEVEAKLRNLEVEETVGERLIDAFPGYYGRFVCMHFSRFLDEPVETEEQRAAYETVIEFLDGMPAFQVPEDVEAAMSEVLRSVSLEQIGEMLDKVKGAIEEPEAFLEENRETLEWYLAYRRSEEYKNCAAGRWMECIREFQSASGYTEVFLPAMRRLSPSYGEYCRLIEAANERLLERYPEVKRL